MGPVKRSAAVTVSIVALVLGGCGRRKEPPKPAEPAHRADTGERAAKKLRGRPKAASELATTDAQIYLGNLDGQIAELTRLTREHPDLISNVHMLSAAHHVRGRYRGDLDEIQLGIDEASACMRLDPENAGHALMRAEQEQSLHRFKEARQDLERARQLGASPSRVLDLETELDWNDGLYDKAILAIRKARLERPSSATWMREAQLNHDLDREDDADAAFEAAEDLITDTAPLPVAHLNVQRGIQKSQRGLLEEACGFFREALSRMPSYVAANEHLAEALHALGRDDEATAIYEKVVTLSDDPEFLHALAALYAVRGRPAESRELEAKARARYDDLLQRYPEAMYWHASEFYLATGDTKRALDLLRKNITLRPNSTSYVALAHAELANGRVADARTSIDRALGMPVRSASLFATASAIYGQAGEITAAEAFRARARRMNPRLETGEDAAAAPHRRDR